MIPWVTTIKDVDDSYVFLAQQVYSGGGNAEK